MKGSIMGRSTKQRTETKGDYPENWKEIADAVKESHNWRCERCGHPHETIIDRKPCDELCSHPDNGKQRMLTVHHLDMNPANCAWWNLTSLCQVCHLQIQGRVDFYQGYMFEHTAWMAPHVEGFLKSQSKSPPGFPRGL